MGEIPINITIKRLNNLQKKYKKYLLVKEEDIESEYGVGEMDPYEYYLLKYAHKQYELQIKDNKLWIKQLLKQQKNDSHYIPQYSKYASYKPTSIRKMKKPLSIKKLLEEQ